MDLKAWDEQHRQQAGSATQRHSEPNPVLVEAAGALPAGRALDLACGAGRNALWLAEHGWSVTAVDGSTAVIDILRSRATDLGVGIDAEVLDLEDPSFVVAPACYNLIAMCYYFQRDLIEKCRQGVVPGGIVVAIALLMEPGKDGSTFRLQPGELRGYFADWDITHYREATDQWEHKVAELVARRPSC